MAKGKTKNILIIITAAAAVILVIGLIRKSSKKNLAAVSNKSGGNNQQITGILERNNWDDKNGYRYVFTDGTAEYYTVEGYFAGSSDAKGNWKAA